MLDTKKILSRVKDWMRRQAQKVGQLPSAYQRAKQLKLQKVKDLIVQEVREELSTPLPANWKRTPFGRTPYMRTGNLRSKVTGIVRDGKVYISAHAITNRGFNYGRYHEVYDPSHPRSGRHPFIWPLLRRKRGVIEQIGGKRIKTLSFGNTIK